MCETGAFIITWPLEQLVLPAWLFLLNKNIQVNLTAATVDRSGPCNFSFDFVPTKYYFVGTNYCFRGHFTVIMMILYNSRRYNTMWMISELIASCYWKGFLPLCRVADTHCHIQGAGIILLFLEWINILNSPNTLGPYSCTSYDIS